MKIEIDGYEVLIDDDELWRFKKHKYCIHDKKADQKYLKHRKKINGKGKSIYLHREITNCPPDMQVDHINGNTLDNRKSNLRICSASENARNTKRSRTNTSGFKGIYWNKDMGKWQAYITHHGKHIYLGSYLTPQEAHAAYCEGAVKYHGKFARTA